MEKDSNRIKILAWIVAAVSIVLIIVVSVAVIYPLYSVSNISITEAKPFKGAD